jgi:hypothetical protein
MDPEKLFDNRCWRIERLVRDKPGIGKSEIAEATETVPGPERDAVIAYLIDTGKIFTKTVQTRGRPKTAYWHAQHEEYTRLVNEVGGELDADTMTPREVAAVNIKRKRLNEHFAKMGLYPLPMLTACDLSP